jgi:hypothetical protein
MKKFFILKNGGFQFALEKHESIFHKAVVLSMIGHRVEDKKLRADCFERLEKLCFISFLKMIYHFCSDIMFFESKLKALTQKNANIDKTHGKAFQNSSQMIKT